MAIDGQICFHRLQKSAAGSNVDEVFTYVYRKRKGHASSTSNVLERLQSDVSKGVPKMLLKHETFKKSLCF